MISKEILAEIGKRKQLKNKEHIEKDYFQDVFLFNLFKKTNKFVFKGGTALYKLYGLKRFSEDLDFSLIDNLSLENIEEIIRNVARSSDFEIKSIKKTRDSIMFKLSCKGILTKYNTLRIDVNFRNRIILGQDIKNYISDYADLNPFSLKILKPEEMIAEKIHSIFARNKARDLFDLFFLLRISDFNKDLTEEKLKIFNMKFNSDPLKKKIERIKDVWEKELKPFIFSELPEFEIVRDFVLSKVSF